MKVLQIIPNFAMGGAEKVVLNYLRYLKDNEDVDMLAVSLYPPTNSQYDQIILKEKLKVIYLNKKKGFDFKVISELRNTIKKFNPNVIHTHLYALKYVLLTGMIFSKINFHTVHSKPQKDAKGLDYIINKICFKTKLVRPIAIQESMLKEVNSFYDIKNTEVINNGIAFEEYNRINIGLRKSLGIPEDAYVIGHVGSFKEAKNHKFIIELFNKIYQINSRVYLLLVGDGELKVNIEKTVLKYGIKDRVICTGNRDDVSEIYHIMDVFLFPSIYEGLGLSIIEAQISGKYCVTSNTVPKEAIVTNKVGVLSLDEDMHNWIDVILHKNKFNELHTDKKRYDINMVIKQLLSIYRTEYVKRNGRDTCGRK